MTCFDEAIEIRKHVLGHGIQRLYAYPNGWGASVIQIDMKQSPNLYKDFKKKKGAWEYAVFHWRSSKNGKPIILKRPPVSTPKTNLTTEQVNELLEKLKGSEADD